MADANNYSIIMQELVRRSNEETRRMRLIEQRLDGLEDKINTLAENTADRAKKANQRFSDIEVGAKTLSNELLNIRMNVDRIAKQLAKYAQKRDLKEIEKMLELLSPTNRLEPEEPIEVRG